jgi:hypothetical protein
MQNKGKLSFEKEAKLKARHFSLLKKRNRKLTALKTLSSLSKRDIEKCFSLTYFFLFFLRRLFIKNKLLKSLFKISSLSH